MIRLLGMPSDGLVGAPPLPRRAFLAMAALILKFSGETSRNALAEFIWPEKHQIHSHANLRKLLASIRHWQVATGVVVFQIDRVRVKLDPNRSPTDLDRLLSSTQLKSARELRNHLELCDGELLADTESGLANETLFWLDRWRDRLDRIRTDLIVGCVENFSSEVLSMSLQTLAERCPYDDRIAVARMKNAAALKRWNEVELAYSEFQQAVQIDLDLEPSPRAKLAYALHSPIQHDSSHRTDPTIGASSTKSAGIPRVVILPPPDGTGADQTSSLVSSFVADLTFRLTVAREFSVIAPFSAERFGQKPALSNTWPSMRYMVSTQLHTHESQPSFSYTLRDAATQEVLLSNKFILEEAKLERQAALAMREISSQIGLQELETFHARGTSTAYVHYLAGSKLLGSYDLQHIRRARKHFNEAIRCVPNYAPALSGLARTLSMEWLVMLRAEPDLLLKAKDIARQIIKRDPTHPLGYREYAHADMYLGRLDSATRFLGLANDRSPQHADILADMADVYSQSGQIDLARSHIDKALELNPLGPDDYLWIKASVEFFSDEYRSAYEILRLVRDITTVDRLMAASAALAGEHEIAQFHVQRFCSQYPDFRLDDQISRFPNQSVELRDKFISALRVAGFE